MWERKLCADGRVNAGEGEEFEGKGWDGIVSDGSVHCGEEEVWEGGRRQDDA